MKPNLFFDLQLGFMLQVGRTYRKEPYFCVGVPFCSLQIIFNKK